MDKFKKGRGVYNVLVAFYIFLSLLVFSGCNDSVNLKPERIVPDEYASGDGQTALHGEELKSPFRVVVESAVIKGLLGGEGSRRGVGKVSVRFKVVNPDTGAVFVENSLSEIIRETDAGGSASARLKLGNWCGDIWIEVSLPDYPEVKPIFLRAIGGVEKILSTKETVAGGVVERFGVKLTNSDGSPAKGVEVYFRVEGSGKGASMKHSRLITDDRGEAVTSWKLGKETGLNYGSIEIRDMRPGVTLRDRFDVRSIECKVMGMNKSGLLITLLGGLAIFIYGMTLLSAGIQLAADRRLKAILQFMTQNRVAALLAGLITTALVQSSSATTVMTVGFVNAGLMTLRQAIGVVYGANIGTTVTAQLIAFRLENMALPAIAIGFIMMLLFRSSKIKAFGQAILGFGLLFLGLTIMSDVLKPLRYSPEFISWFHKFDCTPGANGIMPFKPTLMCILVGTIATCIIQSSSATVGLVQALCAQGLINFYTAVPLILGDNIGTTITANLAALNANRNAKRAAVAHTLFNLLGTAYMFGLFFLPLWNGKPLFLGFVDWVTPGEVFSEHPENIVRHAANAHSLFNIINAIIFLPFVVLHEKICMLIIPRSREDKETVLQYLDLKLLNSPLIALEQAVKEVTYMIKKGQNSLNDACDLLVSGNEDVVPKILEREDLIDKLQEAITGYLVELSRRELEPVEARLIPALIHAVNDAERLGDHAESFIELQRLLKQGDLHFTDSAISELRELQQVLNLQFSSLYETLENGSTEGAKKAIHIGGRIEELVKQFTENHVHRLDKGECSVKAGVIFLDALGHLERVSDHVVNIAERAEIIVTVVRA
ncbi:MAG: Na/Pi cotransporter family protein [Candidatus Hydrogenedentes bacterium]|nr:Na/Pi cotransporter family protein [Candidatus Hydrogenedentota bacterium]